MTLREQAIDRLTDDAIAEWSDIPDDERRYLCESKRVEILDLLQPLFDQVEREKAEMSLDYVSVAKQLDAAMCPHCDQTIARGHAPDCPVAPDVTIELADLRAKLTQAEADSALLAKDVNDVHNKLTTVLMDLESATKRYETAEAESSRWAAVAIQLSSGDE